MDCAHAAATVEVPTPPEGEEKIIVLQSPARSFDMPVMLGICSEYMLRICL